MNVKSTKKRKFIEILSEYDFDQMSKTSRNCREQKRYLAFAHIKEGKSFKETAEMLRVSLRALMIWVKKVRENGVQSLQDSYGGGRQPHVPIDEYEAFVQSVFDLQKSRSGGRIRGQDVAHLIEEKYGVVPSKSSVYETLRKAGLVWITGRSIHPKTDKYAQEDFKKTL